MLVGSLARGPPPASGRAGATRSTRPPDVQHARGTRHGPRRPRRRSGGVVARCIRALVWTSWTASGGSIDALLHNDLVLVGELGFATPRSHSQSQADQARSGAFQ